MLRELKKELRRKHDSYLKFKEESYYRCNEIDSSIKKFVAELNNIDGVKTEFSCSGHPSWKDVAYIQFEHSDHKNFFNVLKFFNKIGFHVRYDGDSNSVKVFSVLYSSKKGKLTQCGLDGFWEHILKMFKEEFKPAD